MLQHVDADLTHSTVDNEDCTLHYWHVGSGPLIIFIPGGNGHGQQFFALMRLLSQHHNRTCATFDRRQMALSQVLVNHVMSPPQQARDARAVIYALGFETAVVFGSSGGGIISLQLALDHPDVVEHVISHEAPTLSLLPDCSAMFDWLLSCLAVYRRAGPISAFREFDAPFVGYDDQTLPRIVPMTPESQVNFWENEFLVFLTYVPDLRRLADTRVSIGLTTSARSGEAWYARTTLEQEQILGCPRHVVPGHHQGFEVEADAFLPALLKLLQVLEEKKQAKAEQLNSVLAPRPCPGKEQRRRQAGGNPGDQFTRNMASPALGI